MAYFVEVVLPLPLPKTFTYKVSETEFAFIQPGMRIAVPFGKSKIYTALAIELHQNPPSLYEAKEIHQILDTQPIVNQIQIEHWQWISKYYLCSIGDVYRGAIPSALLLESETVLSQKADFEIDNVTLSDDEYLVYEAFKTQPTLTLNEVMKILNKKTCFQ